MADKCTSCSEVLPIEHAVCVHGCKLHFNCAGIKEATWKRSDPAKWKCQQCRKVTKPEDDTAIPNSEMRHFMNTVMEKLATLDKLSPTIKGLETSMQFLSDKYDALNTTVSTQETTIAKLLKEAEERDKVIKELEMRMVNSEQYARNRNIEIINVQQNPNEDLVNIVGKLARELGVDYEDGDIDVVHRVPTRSRGAPPKIIVQFKSRTQHALWMEKRHQGVAPYKIVPNSTSTREVRICRHLTEHWRNLLWEARQKGRPLGYTMIWFKDNKIIAKKNLNDTDAKILFTLNDLVKLQ